MVVSFVLTLGKCRSSVASGILLIVQQELTCGFSVCMNLWLPLFNPMLLPQAVLAYRLEWSMWEMKQLSKTHAYPFSPLPLPVGLKMLLRHCTCSYFCLIKQSGVNTCVVPEVDGDH